MSIVSIIAKFECDACGAYFSANLDEARQPPDGWSLTECAEDEVRGGGDSLAESPSIGDCGEHLCPACTRKADQEYEAALSA